MKIVIVNSFFPPWRGGAETYAYNLSRELQRRGHQVLVICGSPPLNPGRQFLGGVEVERLRTSGKVFGTPIMPQLLQKLIREEADVIHANFPSPYVACLASVASCVRRVPAVLTWHNDLPPVTPIARVLVLAHDHFVLPFYLPQFGSIIATSEIYAKTSPILIAEGKRVVVIPNGVDSRRFNPDVHGDRVRSLLGMGRGKIVLFVGALTRWHRYKGLDVLIRAMGLLKHRIPEVRLLVVGAGELQIKYRQLAHDLDLGDTVVFAGDVPDRELPEYYASSDLLALPSKDRSEGFGLTILEANAAGKPAIGTRVGGIPSVIQNGYNGLLVPPNDPQALAEAIRTALADADCLKRMGKNARRLAEQQDWSVVAEQTERLYSRVLPVW